MRRHFTPGLSGLAVALAAALGLVATGCGGSSGSGLDPRRLCAALIACGDPPAERSSNAMARCVQQITLRAASGAVDFEERRLYDCYTAAANCAAARECVSRTHGASYCSGNPERSCDGDVLVDCAAAVPARTVDCARLGMRCQATGPRSAVCTTGRMCASTAERCDGNRVVRCEGQLEQAFDCGQSTTGSRCAVVTTGSTATARCLPDAEACTPSAFTQRCEANARVVCFEATGRIGRVACEAGATCMVRNGAAACVPEMTDCGDGEADACDGDGVRFCLNARRTRAACDVVGARTCGTRDGQAVCQ